MTHPPAPTTERRATRSSAFPGRGAWTAQCRIDSPLGPMLAVRTTAGLAGLWFDGQAHHPGIVHVPVVEDDALFNALAAQLQAAWQGHRTGFDLPLDPAGTAFQRAVWDALLEIPHGQTRSYGELARHLGRPDAARAVGAAVGRNPISWVVPCHRVLGQDGSLTGYAGGIERKTALLQREGALLDRPS